MDTHSHPGSSFLPMILTMTSKSATDIQTLSIWTAHISGCLCHRSQEKTDTSQLYNNHFHSFFTNNAHWKTKSLYSGTIQEQLAGNGRPVSTKFHGNSNYFFWNKINKTSIWRLWKTHKSKQKLEGTWSFKGRTALGTNPHLHGFYPSSAPVWSQRPGCWNLGRRLQFYYLEDKSLVLAKNTETEILKVRRFYICIHNLLPTTSFLSTWTAHAQRKLQEIQ